MFGVASYRFRTTFARRRGGLLAIVLLIGVLGGLAMGAVAGARRTQSSFPAYLASTNPPDLEAQTGIADPTVATSSGYNASLAARIGSLPHVKRAATFTIFNPEIVALKVPHATTGGGIAPSAHAPAGEQPATLGASADGEFSTMDRPFVVHGRLADPTRADEVVVTQGEARFVGIHVGSVIPIGIFTNAQVEMPNCCTANGTVEPHRRIDLKVVGIVVLNNAIVQDAVDALGAEAVVFTPAFDREFRQCCSYFSGTLIQVDGGSSGAAAVTAELRRFMGKGGDFATENPVILAKAERAIKPESIALGVFGAIAALAALLVGAQLIGRQIREGADDRVVLRALGAGPGMTTCDSLIGVVGAVVAGSLLAVGVAVGLSPLAPLGPARPVDPHAGIAFDWTVLGVGLIVSIGALGAIAFVLAYRQAPHRAARRAERSAPRGSRLARVAANAGMPAPTVAGIRFALEPGRGKNTVPVRSAILGAVLAIGVAISTVTFSASLTTLVSRPALYGWNWDYELLSGYGGQQDLPEHQTAVLLDHDRSVAGWVGIYFSEAKVDGQVVPLIGTSPKSIVAPPLLSGHGVEAADQVVVGATTLADLHKRLGDLVVVKRGSTNLRLRIVGTATMPTIGTSGNPHPTMGTGALLSYRLIPAAERNPQDSEIPGPNAFLIRIRGGVNRSTALRSLQRINATLEASPDGAGGVTSVLRPAEIVNYRSQQHVPAYLGAVLAACTAVALGMTLIASVRRRRRDLALLKTLGFTRRQLAAVVGWQSTIAVGIGVVVGVPLGIVVGRALWDLFAHAIDAVPDPTVPALTIALVAIGALVLANIVAAIPALQAARTRTALLLRAE
jgi:ABC-type antimicrobial peptide transport system permease subunit